MSFAAALAPLNDALINTFGESVEFVVGSTLLPATASYRAPWQGDTLGGLPIERLGHSLELRTSDWDALVVQGVGEGTQVTVRGLSFRVTERSADDGGMTRLVLARWTP